MTTEDSKKKWSAYCKRVLEQISPLLREHGYELASEQSQIIGERFLTRPVSGGRKLVLFGRRITDGTKVVIKVSEEPRGIEELEHERRARQMLERMKFAYRTFYAPRELEFIDPYDANGFAMLITEFIEQEQAFLTRPLEEQFTFALTAFKAQEGAHATASSHQPAKTMFAGEASASDYCKRAAQYAEEISGLIPKEDSIRPKLAASLRKASELLHSNEETLERYGGFLTHWDFIPQNFRIREGKLYLLDHSSIRFGNKYEGWARFINFMVLYNPSLADALIQYVADNRTPEESLALRLMRVYRLVELIRYYAGWLPQTEGDLHELTKARIGFWTDVLEAVLADRHLAPEIREAYRATRDRLRSEDEKERQVGLH